MNAGLVGLFLVWSAQAPPDYAKLLESAKLPLSEAIEKGAKEAEGAKPVSAYLEENDGKPRYFLYFAKGTKSIEVELDLKDGSLVAKRTLDDDDSKIAGAVRISLRDAIATALKSVPGKAVYADFDLDENGPPEAEVDVFASGKVTRVFIHAVTGTVIKTEPK